MLKHVSLAVLSAAVVVGAVVAVVFVVHNKNNASDKAITATVLAVGSHKAPSAADQNQVAVCSPNNLATLSAQKKALPTNCK